MNVCSVCGERTWNYEGGTRVCMNGHKTASVQTVVENPVWEKPRWLRWKLTFGAAWLFTIGVIVATELLVK